MLRPAGGERAMASVTGALAVAHAQALDAARAEDPPLEPLLGIAASLLPSGGHLVIASALDAPGPDFERLLGLVAERVSVRLLLVSDAFERARRPGFFPFALSDGRRGSLRADGTGRGCSTPASRITPRAASPACASTWRRGRRPTRR